MLINDKEHYNEVKETINMNNMRKLIDTKNYSITKLATNACVSDSTIISYLNGQKIPSVTTLISISNYLNCNIDFLLGRTNNPMKINELNNAYSNDELNLLIYNIASLPKDKQDLVEAYVKGLIDNN
jgi:transcriptional regulator with XRE-family HTH domain